MLCQENRSFSPAVKPLTIITQVDKAVSKIDTSLVTKFANILLLVAKQGDRLATSQLVGLLLDTFFKRNISKRYVESLADCRDVTARNTTDPMKNYGLPSVLVRRENGKKDLCSTPYVKRVTEML